MDWRFELTVFERKDGEMGLTLSQMTSEKSTRTKRTRPRSVRVWGLPRKVMTETLLNTLKKEGYRPTELSAKRKKPFSLNEASGVRLGLIFFALKPMRKSSRMEEILAGINRMSDEEAYYWYAKCVNGKNAQRSRRALRILLAGE